ncbi:hypothetical protein Pint_02096 [Pistacia integerrima]|uniref:Uncharacterized protein n=1 Tax=Pistacia integerrima TaxID=434235 RepID=A0ACC0ZM72_9ROSI|nr:hypothetical protein Pint_02096 [Pistacia integerrima]
MYVLGLPDKSKQLMPKTFAYSKPLLLSNLRTTKMNDDVLAIAVSVDAKYIAAALLDCTVKIWGLDFDDVINPFKLILIGHHADVWCLAISNSGDYIVTGSHDRSICHWDRTEEPISLSGVPKMQGRERKEVEEIFESDLDNATKRKPGGNVAKFQPDIRMLGLSPSHYVLRTLSNVKTNDLEQTLLVSNSASFIFLPSRIVFCSLDKKKAI